MKFPYLVQSEAALIQQIAVSMIPNGYVHYVACTVPDNKDPERIDRKLAAKYGFDCSKWARYRLPLRSAKIRYLRFGTLFVLLATGGENAFFSEELQRCDFRRTPFKRFGYSISATELYGQLHPSVRMTKTHYEAVRSGLLGACSRGTGAALSTLVAARLLMYSDVRGQAWRLIRDANRELARRGCAEMELSQFFWRRKQVKVFASPRMGGTGTGLVAGNG